MGISALRKPNTVCFRGYERPINEMLQSCTKIFRGAASDPIFIKDNMLYDPCWCVGFNSHICGIVILKKVHWNYTGRKNHHLPEHPLYRQVQKTNLAYKRDLPFHLFGSASLGLRNWPQIWSRNLSQQAFWLADRSATINQIWQGCRCFPKVMISWMTLSYQSSSLNACELHLPCWKIFLLQCWRICFDHRLRGKSEP